MALSFDIHDRNGWYFGAMTRQEATELLMAEREGGVFLVRDSATIIGDFVLCVREDAKVSHYIINRIVQGERVVFRIGDQSFADLPELLDFYKLHYLDTTPLRRPAAKRIECVLGKFDFDGSDQDDLPFRKGDVLYVLNKDEDQWWTARNIQGQVGQIPVPYVQRIDEKCPIVTTHAPPEAHMKKSNLHRRLPAHARVKQPRVPNAYDKTALKLEMGDVIKVTKMNINGQWEGELRGKIGHFPFTHVEFIDADSEECAED
ncbi:adapter molecule Crk [Phlebotomus argentipes]|uniref:adapter molecule Crk n=1 Tax=Phlebotomus argentipes TaxID=94469 RepID=UPI002893718C|nr:adapter molecule Crk [Phlebotomus argentipes]